MLMIKPDPSLPWSGPERNRSLLAHSSKLG